MLERQGFVCTSFNSVWLISCMCFFTPLLMNNSVTLFIMLIFLEQMRNYLGFKQKVPKERALAMGSPDPETRSCFQRDLQQPAVHTGLHLHRLTGRRPASHLSEFSLSSNFSDHFPPGLLLQPGLSGQFLLHSEVQGSSGWHHPPGKKKGKPKLRWALGICLKEALRRHLPSHPAAWKPSENRREWSDSLRWPWWMVRLGISWHYYRVRQGTPTSN